MQAVGAPAEFHVCTACAHKQLQRDLGGVSAKAIFPFAAIFLLGLAVSIAFRSGEGVLRICGAAAAVGGDVTVENVIPKHLDCITAKLREMGARVTEFDDSIRVEADRRLRRSNVKTMPYPGFPTDIQAPFTALSSVAEGTSVFVENIFENRYRHVPELIRLGASIKVEGRVAVVQGVPALSGARVCAGELRGGAALVTAALAAEGTSEISGVCYIDRGYESIEKTLRSVGADISRVG